ncbi:putative tetratricopeptide-like helical domain superfamily [Dioscorea sansibarensis]
MLHQLKKPPLPINFFFRHISDTTSWISANSIFQRQPRLILLERCQSLQDLQPILSYIIVSGLFHNPFVASRILHTCITAGWPDATSAIMVFNQMKRPNLFSWNTMIRALARQEYRRSAVLLYAEMLRRGTELLIMYFTCGCSADGVRLFNEMPYRDVVSWTALISGLVQQGCNAEALKMLYDMRIRSSNATPNVATMVSALSACVNLRSLVLTRGLHAYLEKVGLVGEVFIGNSLIDAYSKCGSFVCATKMFDGMMKKDLHSWTAMITCLASHGYGGEALYLFSQMVQSNILPDSVTFVAVLSACSHAGLVDEGIQIFDCMERVYRITPDLKHYGCMVDLFSRAGLLNCAYEFILSMPMEPNLAILGSLLSACRVHNENDLAKVVAKKIESTCAHVGGSHVLLSNIYANECKWHEVVSIREATRGDENKPPGQSLIEVGGIVHKFIVDDKLHPVAWEMQLVLDGMGKLMEGS